jgi:hypothetical protein
MRYRIEQRIETLAHNAVMKDGRMGAEFAVGPVRYAHWDFEQRSAWLSDYWLAEAAIEADDYKAAFRDFRQEMNRVVPRISLIGQAYTDFLYQPLLIVKDGEQVGFLRYLRKRPKVSLMFLENHREALVRLLAERSIPEEFYYYWNDVVNAVGYTPKVLLMCAAIECLTRTGHGAKDWEKLERILGKELKEDLYGTKEDSSSGLRHRLSHGEYFGADHSGKNYVEVIHKKVMAYFNECILKGPLLDPDIVSPQRHFVGSLEGGSWFIKSKSSDRLSLKTVLADFEKNDVNQLKQHELVYDDSLTTTY